MTGKQMIITWALSVTLSIVIAGICFFGFDIDIGGDGGFVLGAVTTLLFVVLTIKYKWFV